ncbi:ribbon-helix-helix protein, CopG family [Devosia psychrophila]|uniref:Ribbon-helix-helix protein, copG family n=1 Tax=Devosia psychrophila TaxID=728005 RepID=A0A1I1P0K1_9HYPH|nr:ribbon-helix-helix protein, CopG family [Devosia psychrophila]SFD00493.1 Ribbon-helix-helix protein, copG family [Devosia psychrophila]
MNRSKYSNPEVMDERLTVAVPANTKAKIFAIANKRGLPASLLMRQAIDAFLAEPRAA